MAERQRDIDFALELADAADSLTMAAYTGEAVDFRDKADGSPVTEHDQLVEERLRAMIEARYPHDGFLGEETGSASGGGRRWIIDPIDGTASFIRGGRSWATQIALEDEGALVLGVTSSPVIEARWWGAQGLGAFRVTARDRGATALRVSSCGSIGESTWVCYPRIDRVAKGWRALPDRLAAACRFVRPTAHGALMVASGETDVCLQLDGELWDYAAFAAIVAVAGGAFSYVDGEPAATAPRPALFSNGLVHAAVLDVLRST